MDLREIYADPLRAYTLLVAVALVVLSAAAWLARLSAAWVPIRTWLLILPDRCLAIAVRILRDIDLAEDAVQTSTRSGPWNVWRRGSLQTSVHRALCFRIALNWRSHTIWFRLDERLVAWTNVHPEHETMGG